MKTILLADDEANLRMLARITLEDPAYRILEAEDGLAALSLARNERPDLLVLDWMMPGLSGIEVARLLRQDVNTADIPVIMLTAKGQEADRALGRDIGVHAHLVKPFSPLELLQKIQEVWKSQTELYSQSPPNPPVFDIQEPSSEIQQQLNMSSSQLALYVRDLRRSADAERLKAQELADANERLKILDRLKTDFLAFISHELRTPLNTIGAVDIFDPQADPKEQLEIIGIIRRGYDRLQHFIEKGLDYFNWLAASKADVTVTSDLAYIVSRLISQLTNQAPQEGVIHSSGCEIPCIIQGIAPHWTSVVQTLLDNAIKFSQPPHDIRVQLHSAGGRATLTITDHGQGFPPEFAREVFHPFTVTNTKNHSRGSGLSLSLASAITEAYGGTIHAASQGLGTGATFIVEVPLATR